WLGVTGVGGGGEPNSVRVDVLPWLGPSAGFCSPGASANTGRVTRRLKFTSKVELLPAASVAIRGKGWAPLASAPPSINCSWLGVSEKVPSDFSDADRSVKLSVVVPS